MNLDAKSLAYRNIAENMKMAFNPDLPVQTRDGRKARIICADRRGGGFPIMALVEAIGCGPERLTHHTSGGHLKYKGESEADLINIPEKRWVNVYADDTATTHELKEGAEYAAGITGRIRIACLEFTEGDGLENEGRDRAIETGYTGK